MRERPGRPSLAPRSHVEIARVRNANEPRSRAGFDRQGFGVACVPARLGNHGLCTEVSPGELR